MPRDRFTSRDTTKLDLSDDDWIEVKNYLTFAETATLSALMARAQAAATSSTIDVEAVAIDALELWIVDWSFHDKDGKTVDVTRDAIAALRPDDADEVQGAIAKHVTEMNRGKAPTNGARRPRGRSR